MVDKKNEKGEKPKKSKYAKVSSAKPQRAANYPRPGHYLVRIDAIREDEDSKNIGYIANEMTNVHTFADSEPGYNYVKKAPMPLHKVGETFTDVIKSGNVAFAQRTKGLAMAVGNLTQDDFDKEEYEGEIIDQLVSEDAPGAGKVLEIKVQQRIKKDSRSKAESELGENDQYTTIGYVRCVPFSEVAEILEEEGKLTKDQILKFFPDIKEAIEAEGAEEDEGKS